MRSLTSEPPSNMKIRYIAFLLLCLCWNKVKGQGGGIQMKISQSAIKSVASYLLDNELIPTIRNDLKVKDFSMDIGGPVNLLIQKLKLHSLVGQHVEVEILDGNQIRITIGFNELALKANLTSVIGDDVDVLSAPNTIVYFGDCQLMITFSIGSQDNSDSVKLDACKASIGLFKAEGNLGTALEGVYTLTGDSSVASLMEEICPSLENLTNENLNKILSVQETVFISSREYGKLSVIMKLFNTITGNGFVTMEAEVAIGGDNLVGDISFPKHDLEQSGHDVVLFLNGPLLSKIFELIVDTVMNDFRYQAEPDKVSYVVEVNTESIQTEVALSDEGTSLTLNATFDVDTDDSCQAGQLSLHMVIPIVYSYNDALIAAGADVNRLQSVYKVEHWNPSCGGANDRNARKRAENILLQNLKTTIETRLQGKSIDIKLPKDKTYGFNKPQLMTKKGGVICMFSVWFGDENRPVEGQLKHLYNKNYDTAFTSYEYSDGEMDNNKSPISAATASLCSILLIFAAFVLSMHARI